MIIGIGIDLIEIERIKKIWQRYGIKFALKVLTDSEIELLFKKDPVQYIASRFAAKEAAVKAFGTGFVNGITFKSFKVKINDLGKPELIFKGKAEKMVKELGVNQVYLSITHTRSVAGAIVVLEG